jgi:hypothetical protein
MFLHNTAAKTVAGDSLAAVFALSCRKILRFGVLRSFAVKIFPQSEFDGRGNTLCIPRSADDAMGKKIGAKPYKSLCETA